MNRRSLLSLLALTPLAPLLASVPARADEVYIPPPRLEMRAEPATYAREARSVTLAITNPSHDAISLSGARLVCVTGGVRVPLQVTSYALDGQARPIFAPYTLAAGATVRARFDVASFPAAALASGHLELSLRFLETSETAVTLRRA